MKPKVWMKPRVAVKRTISKWNRTFTRVGITLGILTLSMLTHPQSSFAQNSGAAHAMNPDVGANFLVEGQKGTTNVNNGVSLREAEFVFKSDVDPYLTANMIFSVAPTAPGAKDYSISPEEVYASTTFIPNVTLQVGKFYGFFGKHNLLHTHAFPLINAPLVNVALLGDEGLNAPAVSAAYLLPTDFFSELTVEGLGNFKTLAHARTLFDVNEDSTLELGVSGVTGWAYGADITFKHRPTDRGQGRRLNIAGEWMSGKLSGFTQTFTPSGKPTQGFDVYGQYEFVSHTYAEYRFDDLTSQSITRHAVQLAYSPSEFSVFRLEYDYTNPTNNALADNRVLAQVNITIGFHPAHSY